MVEFYVELFNDEVDYRKTNDLLQTILCVYKRDTEEALELYETIRSKIVDIPRTETVLDNSDEYFEANTSYLLNTIIDTHNAGKLVNSSIYSYANPRHLGELCFVDEDCMEMCEFLNSEIIGEFLERIECQNKIFVTAQNDVQGYENYIENNFIQEAAEAEEDYEEEEKVETRLGLLNLRDEK